MKWRRKRWKRRLSWGRSELSRALSRPTARTTPTRGGQRSSLAKAITVSPPHPWWIAQASAFARTSQMRSR
eukprot:6300464-Alexandrium_andersonii.AAC.1